MSAGKEEEKDHEEMHTHIKRKKKTVNLGATKEEVKANKKELGPLSVLLDLAKEHRIIGEFLAAFARLSSYQIFQALALERSQ